MFSSVLRKRLLVGLIAALAVGCESGSASEDEGIVEADTLAQVACQDGGTTEPDDDAGEPPVGTPADGGGIGGGKLPPVTSLSAKGPFNVTIDQRGGGNTWIFHPTELGRGGVKHPVFVWGTGATSVPRQYTDHFNLIASHGFVVISPNTGSVNGNLLKNALNWIIAQNTAPGSKFNGKLDTTKIAMGGHSLGSVSTFDAEATETRLTTTLHIAGGSFDGRGSSKVRTPTAYLCGAAGDIALPQCKVDFQRVGSQPTFYSELQQTGHIDAARKGLPAMVGWLRWHLAGETQWKKDFSPGGQFFQGIFKSQVKNWN